MEWSPCQWWWIGRRICKEKNYQSAEIWQWWGQISLGEPFYWLRSPKDVTKPRLKTSPLGSQSHSLLCVWQNNKSKALNLKVSFNTVSKTNFHLFVSAIYHLHLIQLCPLHKRLGSARESKRARVFVWLRGALVWFHEGGRWGLWVRVLIREKWELLSATRATRESVRVRRREKRKNLIIDAKKPAHKSKQKLLAQIRSERLADP